MVSGNPIPKDGVWKPDPSAARPQNSFRQLEQLAQLEALTSVFLAPLAQLTQL
jgi:hypothetical protein